MKPLWIAVLITLVTASCGGASSGAQTPAGEAPATAQDDETNEGQSSPAVPAQGAPSTDASSDLPTGVRLPNAGTPTTRSDGSTGVLLEGDIIVFEGVEYIIQAEGYDGPPVPVLAAQELLPEAPDRLVPGLNPDEFAALIGDLHGPTDDVAAEMARVVPFPDFLASPSGVSVVAHTVSLSTQPQDEPDTDFELATEVRYETADTLRDAVEAHRVVLAASDIDVGELRTSEENGSDSLAQYFFTTSAPELGEVRVNLRAVSSERAEGLTDVIINVNSSLARDDELVASLAVWSAGEWPPLVADRTPAVLRIQTQLGSSNQQAVNYSATWWLDDAFSDTVAAIAAGASGWELSNEVDGLVAYQRDERTWGMQVQDLHDQPGSGVSLTHGRDVFTWDERSVVVADEGEQPAPDSTDVLPFEQPFLDGTVQLRGDMTAAEAQQVVGDVVSWRQDILPALNELAPYPETLAMPPDANLASFTLDVEDVPDRDAQRITYEALLFVSSSTSEGELLTFFRNEIQAAGLVADEEVDERDGEVVNAELRVPAGPVTYDICVCANLTVEVTYLATREPHYVPLLAQWVLDDLPLPEGGVVTGASISPGAHSVVYSFSRAQYPDFAAIRAAAEPLLASTWEVAADESSFFRLTSSDGTAFVNRDDIYDDYDPERLAIRIRTSVGE